MRLILLVGINSLLPGSAKGPREEQDGNSQGQGQGQGGESDWDYKGKMLKRDLEAMYGTGNVEIVAK